MMGEASHVHAGMCLTLRPLVTAVIQGKASSAYSDLPSGIKSHCKGQVARHGPDSLTPSLIHSINIY